MGGKRQCVVKTNAEDNQYLLHANQKMSETKKKKKKKRGKQKEQEEDREAIHGSRYRFKKVDNFLLLQTLFLGLQHL